MRQAVLHKEEEPKDTLVTNTYRKRAIFINKGGFSMVLNAFFIHGAFRVRFKIIHDRIISVHYSTDRIK